MSSGPCQVDHVTWTMSSGPCHMDHDVMSHGPCRVDHVTWTMSSGPCHMDHVKWTMSSGPCQVDHVTWTMMSCHMDHVKWTMSHGPCQVDHVKWPCQVDHVTWTMSSGPCHLNYIKWATTSESCHHEQTKLWNFLWFLSACTIKCASSDWFKMWGLIFSRLSLSGYYFQNSKTVWSKISKNSTYSVIWCSDVNWILIGRRDYWRHKAWAYMLAHDNWWAKSIIGRTPYLDSLICGPQKCAKLWQP